MNDENASLKETTVEHLDVSCSRNAYDVSNATFEKLIYEFGKNYWLEYSYHDDSQSGVITFRLPEDVYPSQIEKIKFINPEKPKTSWGGLEYYGKDINIDLAQQSPFVSFASNQVACSIDHITFKGKTFYGIKVDTYDGWGAHFKSEQTLWFNWFYNDDHNYIQIFYTQYAESWRSVSNGKMWWNLGQGIEITLLQPS